MIDKIIKRMGSQAGMALTASTLFIFVVLSIMAFYLARFSILSSESAGYYLQNIRARNLVQTGLEIGLQTISTSYSSLQSSITGKLNKGTYTVSVDNSKDEVNSNLAYNHYSLLKSTTVVGGVHRAGRLIISPYPNAFNLSLFSDNQSNGTFNANSNSSITGDFFFNGTISNVTMGNNSVAYSSSSSSSSPIIFHGLPKPSFPVLNHSIYTNILATVSGLLVEGKQEVQRLRFGTPVVVIAMFVLMMQTVIIDMLALQGMVDGQTVIVLMILFQQVVLQIELKLDLKVLPHVVGHGISLHQ
jgi:hypothetical protein